MKLYQYMTLVDRLKKNYSKKKSMIINPDERMSFVEKAYDMAESIEKELSSDNNGYSTFRLITGSLTFPHKMDNGKEVNSVEEMFFELCNGGGND